MSELPLFCPNMACGNHRQPEGKHWYRPFGWYQTKAHGRVKRFACRRCGKSFSEQTFRLSYYLHLNIDFRKVLYRIGACSGIRKIARSFQVTDKVITNRVGRLARQTIGVMAGQRCSPDCDEALVAVGIESINGSEDSSYYIHHLIGQASQYVYACDLAFLRRDFAHIGLSDDQSRQRPQLELGEPSVSGEVYASFERICHMIDDLAGRRSSIVLLTDGKDEYQAVLEANQYLDGKVTHIVTSSQQSRTCHNPLWAVDRKLGHQAKQFMDTTRWPQEANNCMERIYACAGFHNFFKPLRNKRRNNPTPAEMAGFDVQRIRFLLRTFFTKRFFYSKLTFNVSEWLVWLRAYRTPNCSSPQYLPGYITGKARLTPVARAA